MKNKITYILIIAILAFAGMVSWKSFYAQYVQKDTINIHIFPKEIKGWTSEEMPITDEEYAILETDNAFIRLYTSPKGQKVMLYIIYSQTNRRVAHPPEICFTGSGSTAISKVRSTLIGERGRKVVANKLIFDQISQKQMMFYFFKIGNSYTPSYLKQQFLIALKSLLGKPSGSAMVRLTSVIEGTDQAASDKDIRQFASIIIPLLPKYLP